MEFKSAGDLLSLALKLSLSSFMKILNRVGLMESPSLLPLEISKYLECFWSIFKSYLRFGEHTLNIENKTFLTSHKMNKKIRRRNGVTARHHRAVIPFCAESFYSFYVKSRHNIIVSILQSKIFL